jgi:energy-coupling factor transport system ATP-binding protein
VTDARIVLDAWGWRHAGRRAWAVREVTCTIEPGERVLLLGASGAGKSTLLHAIAGVIGAADEGEEAGLLTVGGRPPSEQRGRTALVMQDPDAQVVLARVGDDVAFGLENLGVPVDEIWPRVREALAAVGLDVPLDRSTDHLSGGQKQRLVLAGALAMRPDVLLLDEPTANLDPEGTLDVRDTVGRLVADRATTLVVVEHRIDTWLPIVDRVIVLAAGGGIVADGPPDEVFSHYAETLTELGAWVPGLAPTGPCRPLPPVSAAILETRDLTIGYDPATPVHTHLDLSIPAGISTVLTGPNGGGKTTLALTLAGLLPPIAGEVVAGADLSSKRGRHPIRWSSRDLLTRIGTVFQEPEHQFVATTVHDEIAIGLRALGRPTAEIQKAVTDLLELLHLDRLAKANPFTLSGGEKRRLSVGTVLATRPRVLILDEPTFGQDRRTWVDMVSLVQRQVTEGTTVVSVTHDPTYVEVLGEHHIRVGS